MANESWKPVLAILDRVCARLDFKYRVSYWSSDGNRIGLDFIRAYSQLDFWGLEPILMLDWSSKDVQMRRMSIALDPTLFAELQREFSNANLVKQTTLSKPNANQTAIAGDPQRVSWTLIDEYQSAIRRAVSSMDANMLVRWQDNVVNVDESGRKILSPYPLGYVSVWSPAVNPKVKIEVFLGSEKDPQNSIRSTLRIPQDPEETRIQNSLIFAIENEFDKVRKDLAQIQSKDKPTANKVTTRQFTFELKMKTDVAYFEAELRRFAKTYIDEQRERGLSKIDIAELPQGFWDVRTTDKAKTPIEHNETRGWRLTLFRPDKRKDWITVPDLEFDFWVSQIGGEYPLLLAISPIEENVRPFVKGFIRRCKELWSAIPIQMIDHTLTKPPTTQAQNATLTEMAAMMQAQAADLIPNKANSKSQHHDVFISYSSLDENIAKRIAVALTDAGLTYWLDKKDILIGEQILDRVRNGITNESDYTLIVLSKNSVASEWCKQELRMAYQKEFTLKRVVLLPITIDQVKIPEEVSTKRYYQLNTDKDESLQSLVREIKSLVGKQSLS